MKLKKEAYGYIIMLGHLCADISGGALPAILPFLMTQKGISYTCLLYTSLLHSRYGHSPGRH